MTHEAPRTSLWILVVAPTIWAAHFLLSYATAAVWCAKVAGRDGALDTVQIALAVYTAVALAGIGYVGWKGYRWHESARTARAGDTPESRHRFLGFATLLLAGVSGVAVLYAALVLVFFGSCY